MRAPEAWRPTITVKLSAALHGTALGVLGLHPAWWPALAGLVGSNHLGLAAAGMWPRSQLVGAVLCRLPLPGRRLVLSFDDGPDPAVTSHVLDHLAAAGVSASFFCIGERARRHPSLLRRIVAEGHRVENHSHTHPNHFAFLAGAALRREIMDAQAALSDITGVAPQWFRAPMGIRSPLLDPALAHAGLRLAGWTRRGYDTRCDRPATVLSRLVRGLVAGDVLLLHDGNCAHAQGGRPVVLEVLPRLLEAARACGLNAVALPGPTPDGPNLDGPNLDGEAERGTPAPAVYASR